jgi:hypothetical protein
MTMMINFEAFSLMIANAEGAAWKFLLDIDGYDWYITFHSAWIR